MSWSHLFTLVICYLQIADMAGQVFSIEQPTAVIWEQAGEAVVLPCKVETKCQNIDIQYQWFVFKKDLDDKINWTVVSKDRLETGSLVIKSLHVNDSGIYHCAALVNGVQASGAQLVLNGTMLIVRERQNKWQILLWSMFFLLVICNTAIMIFIYHKKSKTKNRQFSLVLQELYKKRKMHDKQEASPNKGESLQSENSIHEIYQNL